MENPFADLVFFLLALLILPFWILMLVVPTWKTSRTVMSSFWSLAPVGLAYVGLLAPQL